jgi:hypothetical protein
MVIENRDAVVAGTKPVATYKKQQYVCKVEAGEDGKLAFVYDGKSYGSPSSAGTAVIGTACNGWRFWSIEGTAAAPTKPLRRARGTNLPATEPAAPEKKGSTTKKSIARVFYRSPNQKGLEDGQARYYCNACAAGFVADEAAFNGMPVDACPNGHRNDDPELTTPVAAESTGG